MDVFVGPNKQSRDVWIIDQVDPDTDEFDEHKVMLGFDSEQDAVGCYIAAYGSPVRIGGVTDMSMDGLDWKQWLANGDKSKPLSKLGGYFGSLRRVA